MEIETDKKISIEEAARSLTVSTKTVQRYLASGILTKFKINHRTYLLESEVTNLVNRKRHRQDINPLKTTLQTMARDVVTVSRDRYERLLIELGELRKECEYLRAAESKRQDLETGLKAAEAELAKTRRLLQAIQMNPGGPASEGAEEEGLQPERDPEKHLPLQKPWWQK